MIPFSLRVKIKTIPEQVNGIYLIYLTLMIEVIWSPACLGFHHVNFPL